MIPDGSLSRSRRTIFAVRSAAQSSCRAYFPVKNCLMEWTVIARPTAPIDSVSGISLGHDFDAVLRVAAIAQSAGAGEHIEPIVGEHFARRDAH